MDNTYLYNIMLLLIILLMVIISAIISSSETAITSVSIVKLNNIFKQNKKIKKKSKIITYLLNNYNRTLMIILIINTLINTSVASTFVLFLENINNKMTLSVITTISTIISTIVLLVLGEIIPKILAKKSPEKYFIRICSFIYVLSKIFYPILWWTKYIKEGKTKDAINENELLELINIISENGVLEITEQELVKSAINFDEKKVKNIMIAKQKVKFLYHTATKDDVFEFNKKYKFSRIPIIHKISKEVIGVIRKKDIFMNILNNDEISIERLIKQPIFIYCNTKLDELLKIMQENQIHIAIVISDDKKNTFLGIVTMEDLLEQIIGKIYDEYDSPGLVKEIGHSKWIVDGKVLIKDLFNNFLNINIYNNSDVNLIDWFNNKNKNSKNINALKKRKINFQNYSFKIKSINKKSDEIKILFEIEMIKSTKKK